MFIMIFIQSSQFIIHHNHGHHLDLGRLRFIAVDTLIASISLVPSLVSMVIMIVPSLLSNKLSYHALPGIKYGDHDCAFSGIKHYDKCALPDKYDDNDMCALHDKHEHHDNKSALPDV